MIYDHFLKFVAYVYSSGAAKVEKPTPSKMHGILYWEKNRKTFFDFLSPGLGINVSLFRLRQFEEVEAELGSPVAGVEIGTG